MINDTICFVAGKSGGHIIPCLTLAEQYKKEHRQLKTLFFSGNTPLDMHIITDNNLVSQHIPLSLNSIHSSSLIGYLKIMWNIITSCIVSIYYLWKHQPERIITTGGVVALPVCYTGFLLRIPITIYCLDAIPGKAIKAIAPLATTIMICLAETQKYFKNATLTHYPIKYNKQEITITQQQALQELNLDPHKKTIVILGGSQGSLFLNDCIKEWVTHSSFCHQSMNIIHQTGAVDSTNWKIFYHQHSITAHVFSYQTDLSRVYTAADVIICRAGAGTLFEIQFFNKKCIIVPLQTTTTSHQIDNAKAMTKQYPSLFSWISQKDIEQNKNILYQNIVQKLNL